MLLGIGLGLLFPGFGPWIESLAVGGTNLPLAFGLILMMYPPLAKVNYAQLPKAFSNWRVLGLVVVLNWVVAPLLMWGLAMLFFTHEPSYWVGLTLIGIAPCIAMVVVWVDLAGGNREFAAGLVAFNSLFQVFFYSLYAWVLVSWLPGLLGLPTQDVSIEMWDVARTVMLYMGVPFVLALLTRGLLPRWRGEQWYQRRFVSAIGPITLGALLFTILLMFTLKGATMVELPGQVLRVAIPLVIYFAVMYFVAFYAARALGADYKLTAAAAFTASGNNFELAIAVSIGLYGLGSPQAFTGVIGPLVEVPVLLLLVNHALAARKGWRS